MPPFVSTSYLRTFNDFPGKMKKVKNEARRGSENSI
jgi:hypothetical protein